jgi:hypothetical protein
MSDGDIKQALDRIAQSVIVPQVSDATEQIQEAKQALSKESRQFEADRHSRDMADRDAAREQRRVYAGRVFILVCFWISAMFALLLCQVFGARWVPAYRPLSDAVLIALISSTTVNLIGTLIIVLKYIFRSPDGKV